jgi:NAD(P)-dependent dehydrogenase (short-subunit alcohol dehydrogenase family)
VEAKEARSVLVTGGNRGIGLAIALAFAEQGHRVAVTHRGSGAPEGLRAVLCDVTSRAQVDAAFTEVEHAQGPVEVLVANAAISDDVPILGMTQERFAVVLDTNLGGAFRVARRACPRMIRGRWGRMIFISSTAAMAGARGAANYAAAKAGLVGLARSIAREVGRYGITVNLVSPGLVNTAMSAALTPQRRSEVLSRILLDREGEAAEIAAAVTFLASDAASYITAADIPVDGGLGLGG